MPRRFREREGAEEPDGPEARGAGRDPADDVDAWGEELHGAGDSLDRDPEENPDLSVLHEFGNPPEWRTMANQPPGINHLAAAVLAKGAFLGSRIRQDYVKNLFLMSRSNNGYGSEQMVQVATRTQRPKTGALKRFFGLGRKEGDA